MKPVKLSRLISEKYLDEQRRLHQHPKGYGGRGDKWASAVIDIARKYNVESILDYGCGQGTLRQAIKNPLKGIRITEYDPAVFGKTEKPEQSDLVVCTDVLEHIEPDKIALVVNHLYKLANKALFMVIATRPSNKFLSDGRNAHLIIEPDEWWLPRLRYPGFRSVEAPKSPDATPARELIVLMEREST